MSRLEQILKMDRTKVRIIHLDDWREEDDIGRKSGVLACLHATTEAGGTRGFKGGQL